MFTRQINLPTLRRWMKSPVSLSINELSKTDFNFRACAAISRLVVATGWRRRLAPAESTCDAIARRSCRTSRKENPAPALRAQHRGHLLLLDRAVLHLLPG